jgi:hypothetical protein
MVSLPCYHFRVLHGSEWQDPSDEVNNIRRKSKKYAIADDQEILQEGPGDTLFPPQLGMFPESAF